MPIRILIVAAYASVRAGLHALLADAPGCEVIGEIDGSGELERVLVESRPDVVLYDSQEADRARVLEALAGSEAGLVVLGEQRGDYQMLAAAALHGWAYLLKEAEGPEIAAAVHGAAAGLVVLDRSLSPRLSEASVLREQVSETASPELAPDAWRLAPDEVLTAREREVLQLMAEGLPNKTIAARLSISPHTVKYHVASILAKLGAASRTEAVTLGARRGYLVL